MNNTVLKMPDLKIMSKEGWVRKGSFDLEDAVKILYEIPPWCSWFYAPWLSGKFELWYKD